MRTVLVLLGLVALAPAAAACEGLSPGDHIVTDGASCTLAFIVANRDGLYFATAGHCLADGATSVSDDYGEIGTTVYRFLEPDTGSQTDGDPGMDFGLIKIKPELYGDLNPKMCGWDGPHGLLEDGSADGHGVRHYGYGMVLGDLGATRAREGVQLWNDRNFAFYWIGSGVPGDSGSAVITDDGRAIGVLTHLMVGVAGDNGGTHLLRGFELAAEGGITDLRLVLAGEDPVQVLEELRGAPAPATPTGASPTTPTKPTAPTSPTRPGNQTSGNLTGNATAEPNITPADDDGDGVPGATADKETPGAPLALILLAAALVAMRRNRQP